MQDTGSCNSRGMFVDYFEVDQVGITGTAIMELMSEIVNQTHVTILVASHDANVWQFTDLQFEPWDGNM